MNSLCLFGRLTFSKTTTLAASAVTLVTLVALVSCSPVEEGLVDGNNEQPAVWTGGPGLPSEYLWWQRVNRQTGELSSDGMLKARSETRRLRAQLQAELKARAPGLEDAEILAPEWQLRGPENVGGRITDLAGDDTNPDRWFIASATGGVWRTTNGGTTHEQVFDGYGSPSIGSLAMHPVDTTVLFVGTGESNAGGGSPAYPGDGVWKTTNGGDTWTHAGLERTNTIGRVRIDPVDPDRVYVAATGNLYGADEDRGVFRTLDGGVTWEKVLFLSDRTGAADITIDPSDRMRIFAATWERYRTPSTRKYSGPNSGLWRSEDGGTTWEPLTVGLPDSQTVEPGRIAIAAAPSAPGVFYTLFSDIDSAFLGVFRSNDFGNSWTQLDANGVPDAFLKTSAYWFGRIWVNPTNHNDLWMDGVSQLRSRNGGSSFNSVQGLHADHHAKWFFTGTNPFILEGNDGGLYKSTDDGATWTHFKNLPMTQFYSMNVAAKDPEAIYGGTQDNGTVKTATGSVNDWTRIFGGDGFTVEINPENPQEVWAEHQWGKIAFSTNAGAGFGYINPPSLRTNWHTPFILDPNDPATLYAGGARIHRRNPASGHGVLWDVVSPDLTNGDQGTGGVVFGTITAIAVAPSNSNTLYAGTDDGNVWRSLDKAASWEPVDVGLPERWVTSLSVDPQDDARVVVTFSGFRYNDPLAHVFLSGDHGTSWIDISNNLPDLPVHDSEIHPHDPDRFFIGTDLGVFETRNGGGSWQPFGTSLPEAVVTKLVLIDRYGDETLFASTYGRSIWSTQITTSELTVYADDFAPSAYDGNDGNHLFSGPWQELGDDGSTTSGNIYLYNNTACTMKPCVRITATTGAERFERTMDLSEVQTARLRLDYKVYGGPEGVDLVLDNGTDSVVVTSLDVPAAGESGRVDVQIEDFLALTETVTLRFAASSDNGNRTYPDNIEVIGQGPLGNQPPTVDAGENQTVRLPDQATLSATLNDDGLPEDPGTVTLLWRVLSGPAGATVAQPTSAQTQVSFTEHGSYLFELTADDGELTTTDTVEVTVDPDNDPPTLSNPGDQQHLLGESISLTLLASDPDGDALTWQATGLPPGLSFNEGVITGTLSTHGSFAVSVSVADAFEQQTVNFVWTVVPPNLPPTLTSIPDQFHLTGLSVDLSFEATDGDGDTLTVTHTTLPEGVLLITEPSSNLRFRIAGTLTQPFDQPVTLTVGDGISQTQQAFAWTIETGHIAFEDDFETDLGWITNPSGLDDATTGHWEVGTPGATVYQQVALQVGAARSGTRALITDPDPGSSAGTFDIDRGTTSVRSPEFFLPQSGLAVLDISWYFAHFTNGREGDFFRIQIETEGTRHLLLEQRGDGTARPGVFTDALFDLSQVVNQHPGAAAHILLEAADDAAAGGLIEAGVDAVRIRTSGETVVPNRPPVLENPGDQQTVLGADVSLAVVASDPDGDALTLQATGLPPGVTLIGNDLAGQPAQVGTWAVALSAADAEFTTQVTFNWTVTEEATTLTGFLLDDFDPAGYGGNDGYLSWTGDWIEIGDGSSQSATSGNLYIWTRTAACSPHPCPRIREVNGNEALERSANLEGAAHAVLSFDYHVWGGTEGVDLVLSDGTNTVTVTRLSVSASGGTGRIEVAIEDYVALTSTVTVRFAANTPASGNRTYPDNVRIDLLP